AMHVGAPTLRRQSDDAMVKGCTATQDQVPATRVGVGQPHAFIAVEVQTRAIHPPPPRLGVVDGRGSGRQRENRIDDLIVREMPAIYSNGSLFRRIHTTASCRACAKAIINE